MPKNRTKRSVLIARDGVELGMLSESEVRELLAAGFLLPTDTCQNERESERKQLIEFGAGIKRYGQAAHWLKQTTQSISSTTGNMTNKAIVATGKATSFVLGRKAALNRGTRRILEDYIPEIKKLVGARVIAKPALALRSAIRNDELMRNVFGAVHDCLPRPIRRFVPESIFIEFCLLNKGKLFDPQPARDQPPGPSAQPKATQKPDDGKKEPL